MSLSRAKLPQFTFIYALRCPNSQELRYVGKSDEPDRRLLQHLQSPSRNAEVAAWMASLVEDGKQPELIILERVSVDRWRHAEIRWTKRLRDEGAPLFNKVSYTAPEGVRAPVEITKITDWYIRKFPAVLRQELFLYVPRKTLVGMDVEQFKRIMEAYGEQALAEKVLDEMYGSQVEG